MKQTNDNYFIDTNIIVYAHSDVNKDKQKIAQSIISEKHTIISTQVVQEMSNILSKKFNHSWKEIILVIDEAIKNNVLYTNTIDTIRKTYPIANKYKFSFYDSLIVTAALECNCKILYSEDLQHKQVIEKSLTIINPFIQEKLSKF